MSFKEECVFFDEIQMSRPVKYNRLNGIRTNGAIHYVCQAENNNGWISNCPDNCPFFEQKQV